MWQNFHKILLSLLAIFIGISFLIWPDRWSIVFNKSSNSRITEIEIENKKLEEDKRILKDKLLFFEKKFISDSLLIDTLEKKIKLIDDSIFKVDDKINISKYELIRLKREKKEFDDIIDKIKKSPNKKTGNDLLYSVGRKLKNIE
jgi:hypothetical protein